MVDYSKWKDIEISDDEDDTHPNIDTPSLYRWRHEARLQRMADAERQKEELQKRKQSFQARLIDVKERIKKNDGDPENLKKELESIEKEGRDIEKIEQEQKKQEKKTAWNVDTISKPGFEKTVLNKKPVKKTEEELTDEEREERMKKFVKENEALCKKYGMMRRYDDSKRFLQQHFQLVCDETANYLVIWSINLVMEGKLELMSHVAHQCICMQYILELGKQLDVDPRACVNSFFSKIQHCVPEYREQFEKEIEGFKDRVKKRAAEKMQEYMAEEGPGGLDPGDVFATLPESLQKCFETRDVEMLQQAIAAMPIEEAKYHMKRCVDSGLWVPHGNDSTETENKTDEVSEPDDNDAAKTGANKECETKTLVDAAKFEEPIYKGVSTDDLD